MSAPTPATGDGSPTPGYYPDPSIPGYVRYWNGTAWVPGTSRPAPKDGETMPASPPSAHATSAPPAAAVPPAPSVPAVEETGPVFLDEDPDPSAGGRPDPSAAWGADASRQSGFGGDRDRRVSWGSAPQDPRAGGLPGSGPDASAPVAGQAWDRPDATVQDPRAAGAAGAGTGDGGGPPGVRFDRPAGRTALDDDPEPAGAGPDPTGGALPGVRSVGGPAEEPERPVSDGTVTNRAAQGAQRGTPTAEGTMSIRTMTPSPQQPAQPMAQAQAPAQAPVPAQQPTPTPPPSARQPQEPEPQQPPVSAGSGGGSPSWAQQVHRLAQTPEEEPPVVPWKPPVSDPFLLAAQAQASARPAKLGRRLAARLIDTAVLGALVAAASYPFVSAALAHIDEKIQAAKLSGETVTVWLIDGTTAFHLGLSLITMLVLGTLYEALPTSRWGRTLGKRLLGLQVRDIESHEPPSFVAALLRWLVHGFLGVLVVGVLNVLWCVFDRPWRQCWHDKAAHTFVAG
ncbi:RDD family protein [Streptomyces sp. HNM0645]|uniref:RDD family protein n=1 Tax=Streptomyces sp. HNM0645 TaxID=2782343 RepID=UPI0024B719C2|nr:RDD family protein [Streptomyces sp. HNM0645]MDI9886224.1 RDD family protein [Streptomyces sp. HNM0645]